MTVTVEFHFDFGSPNAYLAELVLPQIEKRTGVVRDVEESIAEQTGAAALKSA